MKVAGSMTSDMGLALRDFPTETLTSVSTRWAMSTARGFTSGRVEIPMTANGSRAVSTAMECGTARATTATSASGSKTKPMGTVCMNGPTETNTKGDGACASVTVKATTFLLMETFTSGSTITAELRVMACTSGLMGTAIPEFFRMERSLARDIGRSPETTGAINMRENILETKSMDLASSAGQVAAIIEVCTRMILSRDMVRCPGQMEVCIEDSGMTASSMVWV